MIIAREDPAYEGPVVEPPQQKPLIPSTDEVDALVATQKDQRTAAVGEVLRQAAQESPDRKAQALSLSKTFGVPPDVVERNLEDYQKLEAERLPDVEHLNERAPGFASWLVENADKAALVKDHVPAVVKLEANTSFLAQILRGSYQVNAMFGRFLQQIGDTVDSVGIEGPTSALLSGQALGKWGREYAEWNEAESAALGGATAWKDVKDLPSLWQWSKEMVGTQIPIMGPMAIGGMVGGAVAATAGVSATLGSFMGALVPTAITDIGDTRGTLAERDPNAKAPWAIWVGGSAVAAMDTAAFELLGVRLGSKMSRIFGPKAAEEIAAKVLLSPVQPKYLVRTAAGTVRSMASEGFTEAIQQAIQEYTGYYGANQPADWAQVADAMKEAAAGGALLGGLMGGYEGVVETHGLRRQYAQAMQTKAVFEALGKSAEEIPASKLAPEVYQALVQRIAEKGPVANIYLPTESFVEYWQSKDVSPEAVAEALTGNPKALEEAEAAGLDLKVPTGAYAAKIAPTEHNAFFSSELKLSQDSLNAREANEVQKALKEQADSIGESLTKAKTMTAEEQAAAVAASPIRQAIVAELVADPEFQRMTLEQGMNPVEAAHTYSAGVDAVYTTLASKLKRDPVELFKAYPLTVGPRTAQAGPADVQAPDGGPAVGTAVAGQAAASGVKWWQRVAPGSPAFNKWFGASQVRTPEGRPQLVYHGTLDAGFEHFQSSEDGIFFTADRNTALSYSGSNREASASTPGAGIYSAYLQMHNPLVVDFGGNHYDGLVAGGTQSNEEDWTDVTLAGAIKEAKEKGHDGVIALDIIAQGPEGGPQDGANVTDVYVVFKGEQVSLAPLAAHPDAVLHQDALFQFTSEPPATEGGDRVFYQSVATFEEDKRGWRKRFTKQAEARGFDQAVIDDAMSLIQGAVSIFQAYKAFPLEGGKKWVRQKGVKKQVWLKALVSNLDFGVTLDVDRTCKRVQQFWNTVAETEKKMKRPMSEDELLLMGQMMRADGDVPGCIFCYVEASRRAARRNKHLLATFTLEEVREKAEASGRDDAAVVTVAELRDRVLTKIGWVTKDGEPDLARWAALMVDDQAYEEALDNRGPLGELAREAKKFVLSAKGTAATGTATYNGELLRKKPEWVKEANERAGLRWLSATDFDPTQMVDTLQAMADSTIIGLAGHEYTKEPWAVLILGKTGMKQNMSVAVHGRTGPFISDDVNGMPLGVALRLRYANKNAGTMLVAKNLEQLIWGLSSPDIDMMIPHHAANWTGGSEKFGIFDLDDFSDVQHEHWADEEKAAKKYTVAVMKGGKQEKNKDGTLKTRVKSPKEVHGKKLWFTFWLKKNGWDETAAAADYLAYCRKKNITPKFDKGMYSDGVTKTRKEFPGYTDHPGYAKLLKDFARTDSPQEAVNVANVDNKAMTEYLERYGGGDGWAFRSGAKPETIDKFLAVLAEGPVTKETLAEHEKTLVAANIPLNWVDTPSKLGISSIPTRTAKTVRIGERNPGLLADLGKEDAGGAAGQTFYQAAPAQTTAEIFTSRLTAAVQAATLPKAPGKQWKATIRNSKLGINQDEFAFAHVDDLEDGTTYTKQQVLDYLRLNTPKVTITELGGGFTATELSDLAERIFEDRVQRELENIEDEWSDDLPPLHNYELHLDDEGTYTITLDDEDVETFSERDDAHERLAELELADERKRAEVARGWAQERVNWEECEIAARRRLETDAFETGRAVEFQDYSEPQSGTVPGSYREVFISGTAMSETPEVADASGQVPFRPVSEVTWTDGHPNYAHIANPIVRLRFDVRHSRGQRVMFLEEVQPPQERNFAKMPALFQKNWREIAFKWALRYAADNNLAAVTWTTGEMQSNRYDLSTVIDKLEWWPMSESDLGYDQGERIAVRATVDAGGHATIYTDEAGKVTSVVQTYGRDGEHAHWVGQPLEAVVGKDLAARVLAEASGKATGLDLAVGGEGLMRLYDVDFPNVVNKLPAVKRNGGRVETFPVSETESSSMQVSGVAVSDKLKTAVQAGQTLFQGERGKIRFGADGKANMEFLAGADLSTFLHETGHLYLEVLGSIATELGLKDVATLSAGEAQVAKDYQILLNWFGVASRADIQTQHHEQFARGFEAYLMEGKAPSPELRSTFARFRAWLTTIYKTAANLNVELSDEVRGVFDRLLAGDEAIERAKKEAQVEPLFATAEQAGMTETEFALYKRTAAEAGQKAQDALAARLLHEYRTERSRAYRERRTALQAKVQAELLEQPVYRALWALQRGLWPDGTELGANIKLSKQDIVNGWGAEMLASLPKPWTYAVEGGMHPDAIAELFGFSSGDEMLKAMAAAPKLEAARDARVAETLKEEFGDIRSDGSLKELARRAVQENGLEAVLAAELRAIARKVRQVRPFVRQAVDETKKVEREKAAATIDPLKAERKAAREAMWQGLRDIRRVIPLEQVQAAAQARIQGMTIAELNPNEFWMAARRAAQAALEAAVVNDYAKAALEKQKQRLAVELYRAANAALDEAKGIQRFAKRFTEKATRAALGKAGHTYLDQVDAILDRFELANVSTKDLGRRTTLLAFLEEQAKQGLPVDGIPAELIEAAQRRNWRQMPIGELRDVRDTLRQIEHLARLKNKLLKGRKDAEFVQVRDSMVAAAQSKQKKGPLPAEYRPGDRRRLAIQDWFASHAKISMLAQWLDGGEGGAWWQNIIRPLNDAAETEHQRRITEGQKYSKVINQHYPGKQLASWGKVTMIPGVGSLSKEGALCVALNWGNETSRDRLLHDPRRKWTQAQIDAILNTLDKRDWQFVQATWDFVNSFWPEIAAKQKRVTGLEPEKVEALPIVNRFGTWAGGYYPLSYDHRMSARAGQVVAASEAKLAQQAAYVRTTTKRGHVETRLQHVELPIRLEIGVLFSHLDQVIHDLTHHEVLIDVTRLLRDKAVSSAVLDGAGEPVYKQFTNALTAIATNGRPGGEQTILDKAASFMKSGTQIAGLGWNLWTAVQQPFGFFNGMARIGPKWVMRGWVRWLKDAATMENTAAWINERSTMMANRAHTATQDLNDLHRTLSEPGGWFDTMARQVTGDRVTSQGIIDSFMWHIALAQRVADIPTWLGAYEKAMETRGGDESLAIALADQAVLDSQGGGEVKDLSAVQRGGPIARLFMTFYSYGATLYNETARSALSTNWKSVGSVGQFLGDLSLIYIMPSVGAVLMAHLLGKEDNDEDWTEWFKELGQESAAAALNTMVFLREFGGLVRGQGVRGWQGPTGARFLQLLYTFAAEAQQGQLDKQFWRSANSVAGVLFKYPSQQVQRTVDGWAALQEGRSSNPMVLFTGPPPKKK